MNRTNPIRGSVVEWPLPLFLLALAVAILLWPVILAAAPFVEAPE